MSRADLTLLRRWTAARVRLTLRTPRAAFFTFGFPLMFALLFNGLSRHRYVDAIGSAAGKVPYAQFSTPSIAIFALLVACYSTLVVGIAQARDAGLLKRVRGTPLPMPVYLGSWAAGAVLTGAAGVVLLFAVAVPAYGVHVYPRMLPAASVTLVLGGATLSALALAVASLVRTAEQAMPVAQFTMLPLSFVSGVWFPLDGAPDWVVRIAHAFPLFHIVEAFDACFAAQTSGGGWSPSDLRAIALWGIAGMLVAVRRFRREGGAAGAAQGFRPSWRSP